jgi:hypothetical protein
MNNTNRNKISPLIRSVFTKQWEENSSQSSPNVVVETSSINILLDSKKNNKPKLIVVYERRTNHYRPYKLFSTPPSVSAKVPLVKHRYKIK